jgi:multimeric flavodoxin WrbA
MARSRSPEGINEPNMTPLIDVSLVLVVILLVATPIRWGAASSLYYKMIERMNAIQHQITINDKVLIRNKVAAFIITGGQDGIQAVAGQMMGFFTEIGFLLPQFPFIAHSLGWEAEDMERNVAHVETSEALRSGARELVVRGAKLARGLIGSGEAGCSSIDRGGRKASRDAVGQP